MKNSIFPSITTVVQAEPWEKGHVARITSFHPTTNTPKQQKALDKQYEQELQKQQMDFIL